MQDTQVDFKIKIYKRKYNTFYHIIAV